MELSLKSYDRLFPNQDILHKGGFGNLTALPFAQRPKSGGGRNPQAGSRCSLRLQQYAGSLHR
jgi:hypothetical protein